MRVLALLAVVACTIPDSQFRPSPDASGGDSGTGVLAIVPSATGITLDENANEQFSVMLSQAPAEPIIVQVTTTSSKLALDRSQLEFTPTNFGQAQTVTVTGLADADVVDDVAEVALAADGVEPVTISATVHDIDVLALVTDIAANNIVTVDEGQAVSVHVRLSNKPSTDITVTAILGTGPITAMPSSLVFTPLDYDTEKTFVFTAAVDANVTTDDTPLTLRMGTVDRQYTVRAVDKDMLNISVSPASITVNEQGSVGNLNVALTQMPSNNVVIAIATSSGHVTTNVSQLTFTPSNYATNQVIQVTAPDDVDTSDDSDTITLSTTTAGVASRQVTVTVRDNDSQQILHDVPGTLTVAENADATFGVTLKFKPAGTVNVAVTSLSTAIATVSPGVLTFDQNNYNIAKTVTVHGVDDSNLVANATTVRLSEASIGMTDVPVNATDDDQQRLVVSTTTLTIAEGGSATFDVTLAYDPGATVSATVSSTNPTKAPASPSSLTFTSANYATPHTVTISPPVDNNDVSETATITVSGAGSTMSPAVGVTVMDSTVVETWGWRTAFTGSYELLAGDVIAYQVPVGSVAYLTTFHTFLSSAAGTYRMALYTDNGANAPGTLVADSGAAKVGVNGTNTSNPLALPALLDQPVYWIAIRFSQNNMLGRSATATGRQCFRNVAIPDISTNWPATWGSASCMTDNLLNLWITTYHQ